MIDETQQLHLFLKGVRLLGGQRAAAVILDIDERTLRRICAGHRPLHDGFFRDLATALLNHADHCRELEREIASLIQGNAPAMS